jgi:NADH:ubiquinone oxidoreductase subunit C
MDGHAILARLRERCGERILATHDYRGDHTAVLKREGIVPALAFCRDDAALAFDMLVDLTAVDYSRFSGREDGPRFEVV